MDNEIRLKIVGVHQSEDGDEVVENDTKAQYFFRNGAHYFIYEEQGENYFGCTKTRVKYRAGVLEIVRQGTEAGGFVFESGRTHHTMYPTPAGIMEFEVETEKIHFGEYEDRICISVDYRMKMDEMYEKKCRTEITAYKKPMDQR